jgi:hypothetical protein
MVPQFQIDEWNFVADRIPKLVEFLSRKNEPDETSTKTTSKSKEMNDSPSSTTVSSTLSSPASSPSVIRVKKHKSTPNPKRRLSSPARGLIGDTKPKQNLVVEILTEIIEFVTLHDVLQFL